MEACGSETSLTIWYKNPKEPNLHTTLMSVFWQPAGYAKFIANVTNFPLLTVRHSYQSISPGQRLSAWTSCNRIRFNGEELLAPRTTPKLEDHPLSAACDCSFNIFASTLLSGGRSSFRNLRMHHAMLIGTGGGHLWVREWTYGFHKLRGIIWLPENRLASQEGHCSIE